MKLIAYKVNSEGNEVKILTKYNGILSSIMDSDIDTLLTHIVTSVDKDMSIGICWNLDQTVAPILKLLGKELCQKLHKTNKCFLRPFSIFYIPGKIFTVKPVFSSIKTRLYDISQYFPNEREPEQLNELMKYGERLLEALAKMGMYPSKLTSPVAIYEQCVMRYTNLPTVNDMPTDAAQYAWQCSGKLWVEAYQLGYWERTWDYDIKSSFPSIVRDLIDIRHCTWINSPKPSRNAFYGYCKCIVEIFPQVTVHPIVHEGDNGELSTPTGTWETYLTLNEVDFIRKWKIGTVKIIDGWWAIPIRIVKPLQTVMDRLLAYKEHEDELVRELAKRMSVGVYGKFGEEHSDGFGQFFNPCWFAEISTQIRLEVAEFVYKHKVIDNLIHVSVDGVLLDKEVTL